MSVQPIPVQRHNTDQAPQPIGPYSQSSIHNGLLYVSGQIPISPITQELELGTIAEQTELVCTNLIAVITSAGGSVDGIIKNTIFIKDMNDFATINSVYEKYFGAAKPARSCVEVARLPKDVGIEIESIVAL